MNKIGTRSKLTSETYLFFIHYAIIIPLFNGNANWNETLLESINRNNGSGNLKTLLVELSVVEPLQEINEEKKIVENSYYMWLYTWTTPQESVWKFQYILKYVLNLKIIFETSPNASKYKHTEQKYTNIQVEDNHAIWVRFISKKGEV